MTTLDSDKVIAIARSWIGVPYRHQSASRERGVDCIQFVLAIGRELGVYESLPLAPYPMANSPRKILSLLQAHGKAVEGRPGVVMFWGRRKGTPTHFGIRSELHGDIAVIHADAQLLKVVEHRIPAEQLPLIHSYWWFK